MRPKAHKSSFAFVTAMGGVLYVALGVIFPFRDPGRRSRSCSGTWCAGTEPPLRVLEVHTYVRGARMPCVTMTTAGEERDERAGASVAEATGARL